VVLFVNKVDITCPPPNLSGGVKEVYEKAAFILA